MDVERCGIPKVHFFIRDEREILMISLPVEDAVLEDVLLDLKGDFNELVPVLLYQILIGAEEDHNIIPG